MRIIAILAAGLAAAIGVSTAASAAPVSPAGVRSPQLAVNPSGATVIAWERIRKRPFRIGIEVRRGRSAGRLGRVQRLAAGGTRPAVAVGPDGTAAVGWYEYLNKNRARIRVAVARPGRGFGRGQVIDRGDADFVGLVGVAVQPNGRVVAILQNRNAVYFALARRGRSFGKVRELTGVGPLTGGSMAVDPRDGAIVLAHGTPLSRTPPYNQQAGVRTLSQTATAFSEPVVVSQLGPSTSAYSEAYPVAVSGPGGTGVAYRHFDPPEPGALNIARRAADGSWMTPERIATAPWVSVLPNNACAWASHVTATLPADGSSVVAWSITTETPCGDLSANFEGQIFASVTTPSAVFGPRLQITPDDANFDHPAVVSAGNEAFVAAAEHNGGRVVIATRKSGTPSLGTPRTLARDGDGDVLLAAAGSHVLAAYQRSDRLQLKIVR